MSSKKDEPSALAQFLRQRMDKIDGARLLYLCTMDGAELLTVTTDTETGQSPTANQSEEAQVLAPYIGVITSSCDHSAKLGLGNQDYSLTWIEHAIVVQAKLEAACFTLYLDESANLGLLDDQILLLKKSLHPFTNVNFLSSVL